MVIEEDFSVFKIIDYRTINILLSYFYWSFSFFFGKSCELGFGGSIVSLKQKFGLLLTEFDCI